MEEYKLIVFEYMVLSETCECKRGVSNRQLDKILSRIGMTIDRVWIGEWIY
jgi:hypothetical protein